jgi:hypothetical protein
VVEVRVADEHDVGRAVEGRREHRVGRLSQPGVHEQGAFVPDEQVLGHESRTELGLDPVDPRGDLVHAQKVPYRS